jgi:hypothetical protein
MNWHVFFIVLFILSAASTFAAVCYETGPLGLILIFTLMVLSILSLVIALFIYSSRE